MKKFNPIIGKSLIVVVFVYILLFLYTFFNFGNEFKDTFKSLKNLNFHEKYSKKLHHIREEPTLDLLFKKAEMKDLLFTKINDLENVKTTVLFQGDSWMQEIITKKYQNFTYLDILKKIAEEKKVNFINAGIASYSPSLMNLQLDVLEKDFEIFPNIIIGFINQDDIGDEICRYKKNKIYIDGVLNSVEPETDFMGKGWFNHSKNYTLSRIYLSNNSKITKTFQLINFKYKYSLSRSSKRIYRKYISRSELDKNKLKKCYWSEMEKYLLSPKKKDTEYFQNMIEEYLMKAKQKKHVKKIILVTFPTKKHFDKNSDEKSNYTFNASDAVDAAIEGKKNIIHINFSEILLKDKNFNYKNIWSEDNVHLEPVIYKNLFLQKILDELINYLN